MTITYSLPDNFCASKQTKAPEEFFALQGFLQVRILREIRSAAAAATGISAAIAVAVTTAVVATAAAAQEKDKNDNPRAVAVREVASHVRFLLSSYTTYYGRRRKSVTSFLIFLFTSYPDKRKNKHHHGEYRSKRKTRLDIRTECIGNSAGKRRT